MDGLSASPVAAFEQHFDQLTALVLERLGIELHFRPRGDLDQMEPDLLELVREFGLLLRVVYRYDLVEALAREVLWYASVLESRGPGRDAFALLLDSWIIAIQGVIKPPECNILADPLERLRADLERVFVEVETGRGAPATPDTRMLVERLIRGDHLSARELLQARLTAGLAPDEMIVGVLLPSMSEIGRRWERNELAVFEEHLATETVQRLIIGLSSWAIPSERLNRTALVACVPGDQHGLTPLALGTYLELRGWSVRSLGRSLPGAQVVAAAQALSADAIFLSLAMLSRLTEALELVPLLRGSVPHCPVYVGGRGAIVGRALLEEAGARLVSNFDEAHRRATETETPHA